MFRNKILVRVSPPCSPFFLTPLSLPPSSDDDASDPFPSSPAFDPVDLQILCMKLSRTWRLACVLHSSHIFIIYKRCQSESVALVVQELVRSLPSIDVGVEEEMKSASMIARAAGCSLMSLMLDKYWRCVGENSFVQSSFACSEERKHLHAINVGVQLEINDGLVFLVSPDVLWFKRHKISDLASSKELEKFENGEVVILEEYGLSTACTILPSLSEGFVIGLSKLLPSGESLGRFQELWSTKHGLDLPSNYFLYIQLNNRGCIARQWYPSAFVLHGSGLAPAPHTIRSSKAIHAFELLINLFRGWDFFSEGLLHVTEVSPVGTNTMLPVWRTVFVKSDDVTAEKNISCSGEAGNMQNFISDNLQLALDFRTPKPTSGRILGHKRIEALGADILSCKGNLDNRVNYSRYADIIKLTSRAQSIQTECQNESVTEKTHPFAVDCMSVVKAKESAHISERIGKSPTSVEGFMMEVTSGESVHVNEGSLPRCSMTEKKFAFAEDFMKGMTRKESDFDQNSTTWKKHTSSGNCLSEKCMSMQKTEDNVQPSSIVSIQKEERETFLNKKMLSRSYESATASKFGEEIPNNGTKSKVDSSVTCKKMKTKQSTVITSDITAKVMDYHSKAALQFLTVAELKAFLTFRKAKVGGKKEELVQRITALLA